MIQKMYNAANEIQKAIQNPFGLDFEKHNGRIYITLGSALNCLGYNDHLEKVIGMSRAALGLIALAFSKQNKERLTSAGHVFRGIMEMKGSYEKELLIVD